MDLVQLISQVGFPIAVATYSLVVLNNTIKQNTTTLQNLTTEITFLRTTNKRDPAAGL